MATPETLNLDEDTFTELDDDAFNEAMSGSRSRGIYEEKMLSFLRSGRRGVQVALDKGTHAAKKAPSVKTGYETARDKIENKKTKDYEPTDEEINAAKNTKVVLKSDNVYLIRTDVAAA